MRLSDGAVYETEWGILIRQELGNFITASIVTWESIFFLNGDQRLINEIFIDKIEAGQQKLKLWQRTEIRINAAKEAADELKKIINYNPIL